ncbi:hypothetical protein HK103_003668 [Boothiomyces macroporosus]|uniref:Uncharacterized protein n=1 Tax=Boothiomyces macroporosus TaxID=261099 RepID=A0AAD5UK36_9FUNG|nr:hypothetical protein HK103_003668 [Boothiomyces macroporosus]
MVEVVEFSLPTTKRTATQPKHEYKQFMNSKIKKISAPLTRKEKEQEDEDAKNDIELANLIKTSNLIQQYTESELFGKDRLALLRKKADQLAPTKQKQSLPMYLGLKKAAENRVNSKIREMKDLGTYTKKAVVELRKSEVTLKAKKKEKIDKGIVGSVGRINKGVMTVSKSVIDSVGGVKKKVSMRGTGFGGHQKKKGKSSKFSF